MWKSKNVDVDVKINVELFVFQSHTFYIEVVGCGKQMWPGLDNSLTIMRHMVKS